MWVIMPSTIKKPGSTIPATGTLCIARIARLRCFGQKVPSNLLDLSDGFEEQASALVLRVIKELLGSA